MEKLAFSAIFTAYIMLMVEVTFLKNWSNWSSGAYIPWDACTCFGCYLYSADWSWIIKCIIISFIKVVTSDVHRLPIKCTLFHWQIVSCAVRYCLPSVPITCCVFWLGYLCIRNIDSPECTDLVPYLNSWHKVCRTAQVQGRIPDTNLLSPFNNQIDRFPIH